MRIKSLNHLDVDIYEEKIKNGLTLFVVPIKNRNNVYVTLTTKFGSDILEFVPINDKKMVKVPAGVAHFLEHKVFEQKDGVDPFTFFSERGAQSNANTSHKKTTYLFSGHSNIEENINFLLDYVGEPYFTDENVEKEKGIIVSECEMYKDKSYHRCYEKLLENAFHNDPVRIPVIGTIDSINSITKEDLYTCYNTFYHPANMIMVVTGNVNPEEIIEIVKKNQNNKKFLDFKPIEIKKYNEPKTVLKKRDSFEMDITVPKIMIGYKISFSDFDMDYRKLNDNIVMIVELNFGETSLLNERLIDEKIVNGGIGYDTIITDDYMLLIFSAECNDCKLFEKAINEQINNLTVTEEEFMRKKKSSIGSIVALSNDVYLMNNKIVSNVIRYNEVKYDDYDYVKNANIKDLNYVLEHINFKNKSVCIVNPKKLANK